MNRRTFCDSVVANLMRYAPYQEVQFDDMAYVSEQLEKVDDINDLCLAVLKINKHTKTGSLSFTFTKKLIDSIKERDQVKTQAVLRSRDWPEVFDNPLLTEEEVQFLERVSAQEKKAIEDTFYKSLEMSNSNKILFPTPTSRREVVRGQSKSIYENCMELCISRVAPDYLSNIIPLERKKSQTIKIEACYSFWSMLKHLYSIENSCKPLLDLSDDENKIVRELLDLEYKVYSAFRQSNQ